MTRSAFASVFVATLFAVALTGCGKGGAPNVKFDAEKDIVADKAIKSNPDWNGVLSEDGRKAPFEAHLENLPGRKAKGVLKMGGKDVALDGHVQGDGTLIMWSPGDGDTKVTVTLVFHKGTTPTASGSWQEGKKALVVELTSAAEPPPEPAPVPRPAPATKATGKKKD